MTPSTQATEAKIDKPKSCEGVNSKNTARGKEKKNANHIPEKGLKTPTAKGLIGLAPHCHLQQPLGSSVRRPWLTCEPGCPTLP